MSRFVTLLLLATAAAAPIVPTHVEAAGTVTVAVACSASPERTTVTNSTKAAITIRSVGSTYQPRKGEPYAIGSTLAPGASVTFQSGRGASGKVLTKQYIYENNVGAREGAKVVTSAGTIVRVCS